MPDPFDINQAEALLKTADQSQQKLTDTVDASNKARLGRDRSHIVLCVMGLYVFSLGCAVLYMLWRGFTHHDETTVTNLSELIKIAILPIVTLVIGYYFGTAKSS